MDAIDSTAGDYDRCSSSVLGKDDSCLYASGSTALLHEAGPLD